MNEAFGPYASLEAKPVTRPRRSCLSIMASACWWLLSAFLVVLLVYLAIDIGPVVFAAR